MTKSLKANPELNRIFERLQNDYYSLNERQQKFAIREFGRIRTELSEILAEASGPDGVIKRARFARIQRQLFELEQRMVETGEVVMTDVVRNSSKFTTDQIEKQFEKEFGVKFASAAALGEVNENVVDYVFKRFYDDGLVLSDRIWTTSAAIRQAVENEIRTGILTGMSVSEMVPRVRRAWNAETWQIRRLVVTEGSTAYRTTAAMAAEKSEVVEMVQMHRGLADRPNHECTILSKEDRYGWGPGVFKPTDSEIYNPHPNCTGYITYVMNEDYSLEGLRKRFGTESGVDE